MMSPEQEFWVSFGYDHELDQWMLKPGLAPMDILEVCRKKLEADHAEVLRITGSRPPFVTEVMGDIDPLDWIGRKIKKWRSR